MHWVITEHVHFDRVAGPWLIRRFIDPQAVFSFVPRGLTLDQLTSEQFPPDAIPLAIPGAELGPHDDEGPLFVKILNKYGLNDPALRRMGEVVQKGVDYVLHDYRPASDDRDGQMAAGLLAFSDGMSLLEESDQRRLDASYVVWDAIYELLSANQLPAWWLGFETIERTPAHAPPGGPA